MKIQRISIVFSFFCIWLTSLLTQQVQYFSAFCIILTFGILHGANDIVLLNKMKKNSPKNINILFLARYVLIVLITVLFFYVFPQIALLSFILISSFHFGEQHWNMQILESKKIIAPIFYFVYGYFILFLLFNFHIVEVQEIIAKLIDYTVSRIWIEVNFIIASILLVFGFLYLYIYEANFRNNVFLEVFYLVLFSLIFKMASLLWGFAIYFIFWHSIPSLVDQIGFLYGSYSKANFILYCKSAFWYWIISIFGIGILYFSFKDEKLFEALFFAFLAAITFPHVWVIVAMFRSKSAVISIPK